jgi:glyoxylase-like metal-dependent hydrolase (beta-lactamase superfamily II)
VCFAAFETGTPVHTGAMDTITLGDVEITRVFEQRLTRMPRAVVFPDADPELWRRNTGWLEPDFWDAGADDLVFSMQTWVLRSEGRTILVDTGVGNGKERPAMPVFHRLNTDFLGSLAAAGVQPDDVDAVVCTHVHGDHVGWNTYWSGDEWVPTFRNAHYVISRADFDYWNPANGHPTRSGPRMANVFEDSVAPVHRSGQTVLWEGHHDVDANLRLDPAPGHTPGAAVLTLRSGSDRAVFVGDLLHTPLQIVEPQVSPCFDEDEAQSRATRLRVLDSVAADNALMLPAHFPGAGAVEVGRDGDGYAVKGWAGFR